MGEAKALIVVHVESGGLGDTGERVDIQQAVCLETETEEEVRIASYTQAQKLAMTVNVSSRPHWSHIFLALYLHV